MNVKTGMKTLFGTALVTGAAVLAPGSAFAYPTLQLDIDGGTYDMGTQTIVASESSFDLFAYLIPNSKSTLGDTYYVSAAISPQVDSGADLGSFVFNGTTIRVTEDMTYGVPPLEEIVEDQGWDGGDLPTHGIYPTYFYEFEFSFNSADQIGMYNTQDRAISGDPIDLSSDSSGGMYYASFNVDTSNIVGNYVIHFDLYNTKLKGDDVDVTQFAPFSHDAESRVNEVPEPGTLILIGTGLFGFYLRNRIIGRKA